MDQITAAPRADFYVYALFRENGVPFYIGKGTGERWLQHERLARAGEHGHRFNIIRRMQAAHIDTPKIKLHEGLTEAVALEYEVALIAAIGRVPHGSLVNLTNGGDGVSGWIPSLEYRTRMSEALRGQKLSSETRAKMSKTRRGKKRPPEAIASAIATRRGSKASPETRAKMSVARQRRVVSPETRAHLAALARAQSPETRAKISAANRGKKRSSETRAKLAAATRAFYERRRHATEKLKLAA